MRMVRHLVWSVGAALTLQAAVAATRTQARLVLAAEAARPGETIMAGVQLKMAPGWHTYWKNSGDSGAPTRIDWQLPDGITAGDIQWPVPEKFTMADLTTYIYHDEVLLTVPLTLASDLKTGLVELKAKVSWLECERVCLPGKAEVKTTLELGPGSKPSGEIFLFDAWKKRLPRTEPTVEAGAFWEKDTGSGSRPLILEVTAQAAEDFFPYAGKTFEVQAATEKLPSGDGKTRFRKLVKKFEGDWPTQLQGIVVGKAAGGQKSAIELNVPISAAAPPDTTVAAFGLEVPASESKPLALMLVFAFIGGLILNVMPCVLPVIALKILGFVQQSKESPQRVRRLGLIYGLGVLVSFLVLAGLVIGVKQAGRVASWGMQFQNLHFIMAMTVLVLLVALNLFGVFEVTLRGRAMGAASELAAKEGAAGAFFNGVLATLLATPCTAPFLGVALGFAFAQPPAVIVLTLLMAGLGLAVPYVVLSWRPDWLKFLPKPGAWMEKFKIAMGFPMLATVVWLFKLTLNHFSRSDTFWFGVFLVALSMSAWIWGEFVQRGTKRRGLAAGASLLVTGVVVALALTRAPELDWKLWSPEAVARLRSEGRPILVDFTADWCSTCQVNMRTSINVKSVRRKLAQLNAATLVADFSKEDETIAKELERFGRDAVPLVLVYPRDARKPPIVLPPGYLTPKIVLDALDKADKG
jgi:thiol:disulfide interchange protein DsbD